MRVIAALSIFAVAVATIIAVPLPEAYVPVCIVTVPAMSLVLA